MDLTYVCMLLSALPGVKLLLESVWSIKAVKEFVEAVDRWM